jgi:glutathione S-transferase
LSLAEGLPGGRQEAAGQRGLGQRSQPRVVPWSKEKPINRWINILYLAERLAPKPSLIPTDARQRALMVGLSHEICGEKGIGWNRRLQLFAPAYASGSVRTNIRRMGSKYAYNESDAKTAGEQTASSLKALTRQLKSQHSRGVHCFVGDALSALDIYWTAFANLLDPLPKPQCPMPDAWRPAFVATDPVVKDRTTSLQELVGRVTEATSVAHEGKSLSPDDAGARSCATTPP